MHSHQETALKNKFLTAVIEILNNRKQLNKAVKKFGYLTKNGSVIDLTAAVAGNDDSDELDPNVAFDPKKLSAHYANLNAADAVKIAIHAATTAVVMQSNKEMSNWLKNNDAHELITDYVNNYANRHDEDLYFLTSLGNLVPPEKLAAVKKQDEQVAAINQRTEVENTRHEVNTNAKCKDALDKINAILTQYYETLIDKAYAVYPVASLSSKEVIKDEIRDLFKQDKEFHIPEDLTNAEKERYSKGVQALKALHDKAKVIMSLLAITHDKSDNHIAKAGKLSQQLTESAPTLLQTGEKTIRHKLTQAAYILANIIPGLGFLVSFIKNGTPKFWQTKSQQVANKVNNVLQTKTGLLTVKGKFASGRAVDRADPQIRPSVKP